MANEIFSEEFPEALNIDDGLPLPESQGLDDDGTTSLDEPARGGLGNDANFETLESNTRLSESIIWKLQEDFYREQGIDAWNNQIPFFLTNSVSIAEAYAELVVAFLRDHRACLNVDEPVYIVELATGFGRFSQYMLRELRHKCQHFTELSNLKLRYVMTDFTENITEFWERHERFKPFVESGALDFGVFRPEDSDTLYLRVSRETLNGEVVKNPVIAIANYFFDSIRQDAFRVSAHKLEECKLDVVRNLVGKNPREPVRMPDIQTVYSYLPVQNDYYKDPFYNDILTHYKKHFYDGSIIFPLGALNCLRNLQSLSNNNLVLIASDKGFTDMDYMRGHRDPEYSLHEGAFSFMVNFDAIRRYIDNQGGSSFVTNHLSLGLQTVVCVLSRGSSRLENLNHVFSEKLIRDNAIGTPLKINHMLTKGAKDNRKVRLDGFMALMRLGMFDPMVFCRHANEISTLLEDIEYDRRLELLDILEKTWDNHYSFKGDGSLSFWIASVLYELKAYDRCLVYLRRNVEQCAPNEPDGVIYFLMGICQEILGDIPAAIVAYGKAIEMDTECDSARERLAELESLGGEMASQANS